MNEMDSLETQLKSWAPRRPSAKLEARLFGRAPARMSFGWLAPAAACLLLAVSIVNPRNEGLLASVGDSGPWVGAALSNQSYAAYFPANYRGAENCLATFEWTNGRASFSSKRPL